MAESVPEETLLQQHVLEVRALLSDEVNALCPDMKVRKFVMAKQMDVEKATAMVNAWAHWWVNPIVPGVDFSPRDIADRIETEVDPNELLFRETTPNSFQGEALNGCPIYWEKLGAIAKSMPLLTSTLTDDEIYIRHVRNSERISKKVRDKLEKNPDYCAKVVVVMDLKGLPMIPSSAGLRIIRRHIATNEAYYAEGLQTLLVINAPIYFTAIWAIVKPWLDPATLQKIRIFGGNFLGGLREVIADEYIPTEYGGSREDFAWTYPENYSS